MAHRIYTGPFETLEERWIAEVALLQKDDPLLQVNVLVGSNLLASYLKGRVASQGRAAANVRFCTFLDLTRMLARNTQNDPPRPRLPHLGASAILQSILVSHAPPDFRAMAGFAGFRHALLDTFRDLRDAGFAARDLDEGLLRCFVETPDRKDHLSGLSLLYRLFRSEAEQFHGVDDDFRTAICRVSLAPESLGCRLLLVYGIYDVTGQQSDLLTGLKEALEMVYFIPFVDEAVSAFALPFLRARERELGVRADALAGREAPNTLGRLRRLHFGFGMTPAYSGESGSREASAVSDDGSFALVSAPGESRAAVEIVREVLRAVRDGTISGFQEAAVILRQPEAEVPILTEAFRVRGIPYFVAGGTSFARRPLARAILALANLESESFSRQAILTAMEWVSAALPADSASFWEVAEWRALTNQPGFLAGIPAWDEGTEGLIREAVRELRQAEERARAPEKEPEEEDERRPVPSVPAAQRLLSSARALRRGWLLIRGASSSWPESASWRAWAQLLQRQLEPLFGVAEDWAMFSNVLDEIGLLEDVAGRGGIDAAVSRVKLAATLEESLASLSCPEGRFARRGVNLISAGAARGLRFPLVVISGLEEGHFPARLRQDPLLLDAERRRIDARLPLKSQRGEEEKLLFDMAARAATRRLVLVTSRLDEASDRERIPSEFFLRAAAAARGMPVGLRDLRDDVIPGFRSVSLENPAPCSDQVAVDKGEVRLRLVTESLPHSLALSRAALKALIHEEPLLLRGPYAYDTARWTHEFTVFDGRLSNSDLVNHVARILGPSAGPVSASRLEEYAKCPYLFYLKRVVGLESWEEEETPLAFDPLERGLIIHAILEEFLGGRTADVFTATALEELQIALLTLARPALEKARPPGMPDLLWEIDREALLRLLLNWLDFEKQRSGSGLLPAYFEHPFGKFNSREVYPELRIKAGRHEFVFRGRIDRIDLSCDGKSARVIDYKTGRRPDSMGKENHPLLMAGEKIQIALYRSALPLLEGLRDVASIEGEYLHLQPKDGAIVECPFNEEELNEACRRLPHVLEIIGNGIESGVFFARTSGVVRPNGHCKYCDYLTVCGKDRVQREERKAADPATVRIRQLAEIDPPRDNAP